VVRFLTELQYGESEKKCPKENKIEKIQKAIVEKKVLSITYLKPNDDKSIREVIPSYVGQMQYQEKSYIGMDAFCLFRKEQRIFRVDRILEIREVE
jgi:predicted DNA-binding transcriptional regulator YafY